jgi:hypothetical protein
MEPKDVLQRYLSRERASLLARLDGLGEREVRWPMTPTAGHADILAELLGGSTGDDRGNLPEQSAAEWAAYRRRLEQAAEAAAR